MSEQPLEMALDELGVPQFVAAARYASLVRSISRAPGASGLQARPHRLPRLAFLYETRALSRFQEFSRRRAAEDVSAYRLDFRRAFDCWRALASLPELEAGATPARVSGPGLALLNAELGCSVLPEELRLAFHLAATGLLAECAAETRLELRRFTFEETGEYTSWRDAVVKHVFTSFVLLCRKDNGWIDIDDALRRVSSLRDLQNHYEEKYLDSQGAASDQTIAAVELIGLYHLAQITTMVGEYLATGKEAATQILVRVDRHHDRAREAFASLRHIQLRDLADLFWAGCRTLIQNCIWTHVAGLPESVREFAKALTVRGRPNPVIELWPSQQEALRKNFLDTYPKAILVEMPTSAGKTLLAKFAIVQTLALSPKGTVVYVVPTRALVNQITLELRGDFRELKPRIRIEQTVPVFELDPTEAKLLEDPPNILVTTPEKLDLLVRSDHPSVANISLVIADEAHNIGSKGRGARLELLLGTLKRDRDSARFLLLSPFLPNDQELLTWLGGERALPPIQVDWKPSNRIVGAIRKSKVRGTGTYSVRFDTLAAADNADVPEGFRIELGVSTSDKMTIKAMSADAVRFLRDRGSILLLCRGRGTAATRAEELAEELDEMDGDPLLEAACRYLEAEVGRETSLVRCLRRGVAYHHAGMSPEAKWLVEALMRRNVVSIVCGTTTLAQGVNFPITSVIVETLNKGDESLTYQDFWNIAGRAGRTLVDTLGVVAFTSSRREDIDKFLRGEAAAISSQLSVLIDRIEEIGDKFNLATLSKVPELSPLLQFLAHAMRVSGTSALADEVEDLLRASLVYHQASKESAESAKTLVNLCRAYIASLRGRTDILKLADTTGFATPSVLKLLADKSDRRGFTKLDEWKPEALFGTDITPLKERVAAIAGLPEMKLGQGDGSPFNPELVAKILRDWVGGETLDRLAATHWQAIEKDPDKRLSLFSTYLFSTLLGQVSWGLGALEGVCLAGRDEDLETVGHVPSMVFFGVQRKQAVWLRMVGVPRIVADSLATLWIREKQPEPRSHEEIRDWVSDLSDERWRQVIPKGSRLRPTDMRVLWGQFCA
jgi:hypothetical protein